jgi:integrase
VLRPARPWSTDSQRASTGVERRVGPIIICERTGIPYAQAQFRKGWRNDRAAAELPAKLWSRDLRASAITESRAGGVSISDAAKVAGHTKETTTSEVYGREQVEAHRRFAKARLAARSKGGTT